MIIFTEHDEVVMSIANFRDLIRNAYESGYSAGATPGDLVPATWTAESYLNEHERDCRKNPRAMDTK